ncbi:MAG: threonine synthase [Erysipelotrichaceae bacterium]|nr:MAG: threonine synthase [Erysipelotrichaceae bacterium]
MKYSSTRDQNLIISGTKAILDGLAKDGGLVIPESFPRLDLDQIKDYDFKRLMVEILHRYFQEFDQKDLIDMVDQAYLNTFDHKDIVPLSLCNDIYLLELYHGPTAAFKDIALSILPYLMAHAKKKLNITEITHILTATSGDTGSAALAGFKDIEGFTLTVFYPSVGISEIQKRQMTTIQGKNIKVFGINGNFDDAQAALKDIFNRSTEFKLTLTSANSINIGRLIPQMTYYFKAYFDLIKLNKIHLGDKVSFSIPTGNFGNILAAYFAALSGLPIKSLICASNENRVLTDFIQSGIYDRNRDFHQTSSPSMDILVSSNLERLLCLLSDRDDELVKELMNQLDSKGSYKVPEFIYQRLNEIFIGQSVDQHTVESTIKLIYESCGILIDPHTAIAVKAAQDHISEEPMIVCATASPFKFPTTVLKALGKDGDTDDFISLEKLSSLSHQKCPIHLSHLRDATIRHPLTVNKEALVALVKLKEHHDHD